eukprot:184741_1
MGTCCSSNTYQRAPKTNDSCDIINCTVIQDIIKYNKWNPPDAQTEKQNKKRKEDYDHYIAHHAKSDDRSKNKCVDERCKYENNSKGTYTLSSFQRHHVYFYHAVTYTKLKTQRSCHYEDIDDIYTVLVPRPKQWNENYNQVTPFSPAPQFAESNTSSGSYPDTIPIDIFLDQLLANDQNKCTDSRTCNKLKALLYFSRNINPKNTNNDMYQKCKPYMQSYWDHYCEYHMDVYKMHKCIHIKEEGDGELCQFVQNVQSVQDGRLQLLLHRHFYHENILKEEKNKIDFVRETMRGQKVIDKYKPTMQAILASISVDDINTNHVLEFGYEFICNKSKARFKNPKEEILKNDYFRLEKRFWNDLF